MRQIRLFTVLITLFCASTLAELGPVYGEKGVWYKAHLTWYESYPAAGSEEAVKYSGSQYEGTFAFIDYQQSKKWVRENNIVAVHSSHGKWLSLKDLRLRLDPDDEESEIIGTVYDICSDSDCSGCCTRNASETGYLIDLEINTLRRMGFSKDKYPYYIYFKIYETEKQRIKREEKEKKKAARKEKRRKRKSENKK